MDTIICAVAGRKQSGKSSLCAYIQAALALKAHQGPIDELSTELSFVQTPTGEIQWSSDDDKYIKKITNESGRIYSFADVLKDVCISVLGLRHEQGHGTDEQKNSLTNMMWECLPAYVRWIAGGRKLYMGGVETVLSNDILKGLSGFNPVGREESVYEFCLRSGFVPSNLRTGLMTAREVMQVYGTDVMRKMFFDDVWVNATLNRIKKEKPPVALISDMRFRSEFFALHKAGAYVIRLERNITHDTHASETDFDEFEFSKYDRCFVIPHDTDLNTKNKMALGWLSTLLPKELLS